MSFCNLFLIIVLVLLDTSKINVKLLIRLTGSTYYICSLNLAEINKRGGITIIVYQGKQIFFHNHYVFISLIFGAISLLPFITSLTTVFIMSTSFIVSVVFIVWYANSIKFVFLKIIF